MALQLKYRLLTFIVSFIHLVGACKAMDREEKIADEPGTALQAVVRYKAKDTAVFDIQKKALHLYGGSDIGYEDVQLAAEQLTLDWSTNTITATGKHNEVGEIAQKVIFTQGGVSCQAEEIHYSFDTRRGAIRKLFIEQEGILIHCDEATIDTERTYYTDRMRLTTCNLAKPHYYIEARKAKFVQSENIVTGPWRCYCYDIPTPLGFFYGFLPISRPRVSRIILPELGADLSKGPFLSAGYHFYFNDCIDLSLKARLYSKGSCGLKAESSYQRYGYTGSVSYEQTMTPMSDERGPWRFQWRHATQNNRAGSLIADIDIQDRSAAAALPNNRGLTTITGSQIRYTNSLAGLPCRIATILAHSQDFQRNTTKLILPEVIFSTSPIYLFRGGGGAIGQWYRDIYLKHSVEFKRQLASTINRNTSIPTYQYWIDAFRQGDYGVKHTIRLAGNAKIFQYVNLQPAVRYQERWYFQSLDYAYDNAQDTIVKDTIGGFKRVWDYSAGTSLQTTLYGMYFGGSNTAIQSIRHQLTPTVRFTYTPGCAGRYWQEVQTPQGNKLMNRFDNCVYGTPQSSAKAVMDFEVDNTLTMKLRDTTDLARSTRKVPMLEALSLSTSYDFKADSFQLGNIKLVARTGLLDNLFRLEYSTTLDPYAYDSCDPAYNQGDLKRRAERVAWYHGQGLGHSTDSFLKIGIRLRPPGHGAQNAAGHTRNGQIPRPAPSDSAQYANFDVPWSLNLTYYRNYTHHIASGSRCSSRQLSFDGGLSLARGWAITFDSAYDLDKKELAGHATKVSIHGDMHCWETCFDCWPFGSSPSFRFFLGLKSSMLKDVIKCDLSHRYGRC
ncbi:MAG: putative LPS assembly protein LptD [Bacteroidota bacterium]